MASSDFLMANQIAWLEKYPCFEQDGCNISYHCSIGLIFWYDGLTGVPEGTKYRHFQCDRYIRCTILQAHQILFSNSWAKYKSYKKYQYLVPAGRPVSALYQKIRPCQHNEHTFSENS
jgi:hypothetical protein